MKRLPFVCLLILFFAMATAASAQESYTFERGNFGFSLDKTDESSQQITLRISGESCTRKDIFTLTDPVRLVVDTQGVTISYSKKIKSQGISFLEEIRVGRHPNKVRLVLEYGAGVMLSYETRSSSAACTVIVGTQGSAVSEADSDLDSTVSSLEISSKVTFSNRAGINISSDEQSSDAANHLLLTPELDIEVGRDVNLVLAARLDSYYEDTEDSISSFDVYADELYLNSSGDNYGIKIGNQKIRWGKTDEVSPLDIVSPEDLQDGLVRRRDDRKIPVPAASVLLFDDDYEMQGVFIPWFEESILPEFDSEWSGLRGIATEDSVQLETQSKSLDDVEYGVQLAASISQIDFTLNFLSTTDDQPVLELTGLDDFMQPEFDLRYHRREVAGASFEYAGDLIGVRGDFAHSNARFYQAENLALVRSAVSEFILGGDYIGEEGLYINLQFGGEYIHDYENSILGFDRFSPSFYGEASDEFWNSYLLLGARSFYNIATEGFFVNPYLTINYWDWGSIEFGADILDGEQGPFGRFKENDRFYILAKCVL